MNCGEKAEVPIDVDEGISYRVSVEPSPPHPSTPALSKFDFNNELEFAKGTARIFLPSPLVYPLINSFPPFRDGV